MSCQTNTNVREIFRLGQKAFQEGRYDDAIARFERCIELQPDFADAYYWLGRSHYELGKKDYDAGKYDEGNIKYEQAAKKFETSIKLDSAYKADYKADAYFWLGRINDDQGNFDKAINSYEQCIQLKPDYSDAYYWWGMALYSSERYEKAAEKFDKSIDLKFSNLANVYYWWGMALYSSRKYEDAAEKFAKSIVLKFSDRANAYYWWGMALYSSRKYKEAIQKYQLAAKNFADSIEFKSTVSIPARVDMADIYYWWGDSLFVLNRDKEANKKFYECLKHDRLYAPAYYRLGNIAYSSKKYEEAKKNFTISIDIQPEYPEAYYWLGASFSWLREYEEAVQQYENFISKYKNFIQKNPDAENIYYIDVHYWLGTAYYSLGKDRKAVEHLKIFIKKFQEKEEKLGIEEIPVVVRDEYKSSYYWLGLALYIEKQIPEAKEVLQKFVRQQVPVLDIENDPVDLDVCLTASNTYLDLGKAFIDLKEYDQATNYYKKSINALNKAELQLNDLKKVIGSKTKDNTLENYSQLYIEAENKYHLNLIEAKYNQAFILEQQRKYNLALEKYNQVIRLFNIHINNNKTINTLKKEQNYSNYSIKSHFQIGEILEKQKKYFEAIQVLTEALKQSHKWHDDCAYIHHKLADLYRQKGEDENSKKQIELAVKNYKREISIKENEYKKNPFQIDRVFIADYWHNNLGSIYYQDFHEFSQAEDIYLKGLKLDPNNKNILKSLTYLYLDNDSVYGIQSKPKLKDEIPECHKYCEGLWKYYNKTLELLVNAKNRYEDSSSLIELGNFLLKTKKIAEPKDYNKVENYFLDAIKNNKQELKSGEAYSIDADVGLGVYYFEQDRLEEAVEHFENALQHEPGNLNIWSNLAEIYQKQNRLYEAEKEFKDILTIDRYHLDSNIILGQVYLAMGDAGETEMYQKAINYFSEAIKILNYDRGCIKSTRKNYIELTKNFHGKNHKKLIGEDYKKHHSSQLADILYLLGYANFQIYQNSSILQRSEHFLTKSLDNFKKAKNYDRSHYFANRAIEKLESNIRTSSGSTRKEEIVSGFLAVLSVFMFFCIQALCILPQPSNFKQEVRTEISDTVVSSQTAMQEKVKPEATQENNNQRQLQTNQSENTEQDREDNNLNEIVQPTLTYLNFGSPGHIILTFGSLILVAVFSYLPSITRLSFGQKGVELEKSPLGQISVDVDNIKLTNTLILCTALERLKPPTTNRTPQTPKSPQTRRCHPSPLPN